MAKGKQRSIRLRPDQEAAIEKITAADPELKRSTVIRRAIDEYLDRRGVRHEVDASARHESDRAVKPYGDKKIVAIPERTAHRPKVSYSVKLARKKTRQATRQKKSAA